MRTPSKLYTGAGCHYFGSLFWEGGEGRKKKTGTREPQWYREMGPVGVFLGVSVGHVMREGKVTHPPRYPFSGSTFTYCPGRVCLLKHSCMDTET